MATENSRLSTSHSGGAVQDFHPVPSNPADSGGITHLLERVSLMVGGPPVNRLERL